MVQELSFKAWMVSHNIKQKEIAELLGIGTQAAFLKINGKTDFTLSQIATICDHYGISADIFLPDKLRNSNKDEVTI